MMNIEIKKATLDDIFQIVLLEEETLNETLGKEMLEEEIKRGVATILVAKENQTVLGYISSYFIEGSGEILNFCVDQKYQRLGIGQKLFDYLFVLNKNTSEVVLEVDSENEKGKSFYLKNGFKEVGKRKKYYANGHDAIVMKKEII